MLINEHFFNGLRTVEWLRPVRDFADQKPLLAHYTSIEALEAIVRSGELWFANPLFMNDLEEVRFGFNNGISRTLDTNTLQNVLATPGKREAFQRAFLSHTKMFDEQHAFDTYVFCLSEHDRGQLPHGLLSMWRGYGAGGQGAAIVFDTGKLHELPTSPLTIGEVAYASGADRVAWLDRLISRFADLCVNIRLQENEYWLASYSLFERIKMFSLFSKHPGFSEKREWRVVYDRAKDWQNVLADGFHYHFGSSGIEPRLRLSIGLIPGVSAGDYSIDTLIDEIILGPSMPHNLSLQTVRRMLEKLGHPQLAAKVRKSDIPFRSTYR